MTTSIEIPYSELAIYSERQKLGQIHILRLKFIKASGLKSGCYEIMISNLPYKVADLRNKLDVEVETVQELFRHNGVVSDGDGVVGWLKLK